jgi:hypothetical protein
MKMVPLWPLVFISTTIAGIAVDAQTQLPRPVTRARRRNPPVPLPHRMAAPAQRRRRQARRKGRSTIHIRITRASRQKEGKFGCPPAATAATGWVAVVWGRL